MSLNRIHRRAVLIHPEQDAIGLLVNQHMESEVESKIIGIETIECPGCGSHENAEIEGTIFFASYFHECKKCGCLIMESEWQPVEKLEDEDQ